MMNNTHLRQRILTIRMSAINREQGDNSEISCIPSIMCIHYILYSKEKDLINNLINLLSTVYTTIESTTVLFTIMSCTMRLCSWEHDWNLFWTQGSN